MKTTTMIKGETVYGSFGRHGTVDVRQGVIISKSPNGTVQVRFANDYVVSFKPDGFQRGCDTWSGGCLIDREQYDAALPRMIVQRAERAATKAVRACADTTITQANRDAMIAKLEAAIEAVKAIPAKS